MGQFFYSLRDRFCRDGGSADAVDFFTNLKFRGLISAHKLLMPPSVGHSAADGFPVFNNFRGHDFALFIKEHNKGDGHTLALDVVQDSIAFGDVPFLDSPNIYVFAAELLFDLVSDYFSDL